MTDQTDQTTAARDRSLVILAGIVAVVAMACVTLLAAIDRVPPEVAIPIIGTAGGTLAGLAIRMSGANGERQP